jgi:inosose dehydratase
MVGLAVAPTAPYETAYSSSSTLHESFQMSVSVVAIVLPSGVPASGRVAPRVSVSLEPPQRTSRLTLDGAVGYGRRPSVIDYADRARRSLARHARGRRTSPVTAVGDPRTDDRTALRRGGDALAGASIGTVPILWLNSATVHPSCATDAATILNEIARTGYEGTQLGRGFPAGDELRHELAMRGLRLAEVYLAIPATVDGPTVDAMDMARERLRLLHAGGGDILCAAIDGTPDRDRMAGRAIDPETPRFSARAWAALADLLHAIADEAAALGHATVFHPHVATLVETPAEIDRLLGATDPARVGLCLDVGHHIVGGGDPVEDTQALGERIRHVHLKDVDPAVLGRLRDGAYTGCQQAVRDGLFTELGAGMLDLDGVLAALDEHEYAGWLMVEQDWSPRPPSVSAAIGRRALATSLRRLGRATPARTAS